MEIISNFIRSGIINLIKDGNRIASTTSFTTKLLEYKNKVASAAEIGDNYPFQLLAAGLISKFFSLIIAQNFYKINYEWKKLGELKV